MSGAASPTLDAALDQRRRRARGPARPQYLQAQDVDHLLHMLIALMSEVSALRDRLDTHELLAAAGRVASPDAVESHVLTPEQHGAREQRRQALLKRTLRVLTEQAEAVRPARHAGAGDEFGDDDLAD